jgi:hypothetical protein
MKQMFGATVPPSYGGYLPTRISRTGRSNRYCIHYVDCRHYQESKDSGNTVNFETESLKELEAHLKRLKELPGGIQRCGVCFK